MAKVGEEDPRWIVKDMGQAGTNVGRWHWTDQNVIGWCKDRLNEVLNDQTVIKNDKCECQIVKVNHVKGEASVSNRKRKLISFYELDVELSWRGEIKHDDTTTKVRGKVKIPYISDENDYDEFDMSATIDDTYKSKEAADIRSIMAKEGLPKIRKIVAEKFVKELRAGAHVMDKYKGWEEDYKEYKPGEDHGSPVPQQPKSETVNLPPPKVSGTRTHTLSLRDRFNLPSAVLFDFFTDPNRISSYTRSPAKFDKTKGGKFENFGGAIHGEVLELAQNEKLVLHWRMRDWLDDLYSTVTLTFEQQGGGETLLTLEQINIPSVDKHNSEVLPNVEQGWQDRFFKPIKLVTGQLMGSAPTFSKK